MKKDFEKKIAFVDNKNLPGLEHIKGGHYVYISQVNGDKCDVHIVTSLEDSKPTVDKKGNKEYNFSNKKVSHVRNGNTVPVPYYKSNFGLWSGIKKQKTKNVSVGNLKSIDVKKIDKKTLKAIEKQLE